jgi:nicotinate-nucleotide adenylyltransferase
MVPTLKHRFDKVLAPFPDRLEMCRLAARSIRGCEVSDIEGRLGGESRTLVTLEALARERPGDEFSLVIGSDLLAERHLWYRYEELERRVRWIVLGRPGHAGAEPHLPDVSSTDVRARLARGEDVSRWLSREVLAYIAKKGLYR